MHVLCACAYIYCCRHFTIRWDFEGGVYWDKWVEICGEISRVVGFRGVVRFEEIWCSMRFKIPALDQSDCSICYNYVWSTCNTQNSNTDTKTPPTIKQTQQRFESTKHVGPLVFKLACRVRSGREWSAPSITQQLLSPLRLDLPPLTEEKKRAEMLLSAIWQYLS